MIAKVYRLIISREGGEPGQIGAASADGEDACLHEPKHLRIEGVGVSERNHLLRAARERTPSRQLPDAAMARQELAEAVNAWLCENNRRLGALDAHYIARLERGAVRWPNEEYRAGFRAILGVLNDVDLGFFPRKRAVQSALSDVPVTTEPADMIEAWELTDALTRCSISNATLDHMERAVYDYATRYPLLLLKCCCLRSAARCAG